MKKVLISLVLCCLSMVGMAQKDVTKFMGIPVDGDKSEVISKLKLKGFTPSPYNEDVLTGKFNGMEVYVAISTNHDKVCRIGVIDVHKTDGTDIRNRFNRLCQQFKNNPRYMSFADDDQTIKEDVDVAYEVHVNKKRFEAVFYQEPDTASVSNKEELRSLFLSKYTKEQLQNPSDDIALDLVKMAINQRFEIALKKSVWFMISELYGEYYISMFYDNVYNRANGEDL